MLCIASGKKNTNCDYFMSIGEADYKLNNTQLIKDLGDTIDPKLNLKQHIYEITYKAAKIFGIQERTYQFLDKKTFLLLYSSLIRPHLDYANAILYPKYNINQSLSKDCKEEQLSY